MIPWQPEWQEKCHHHRLPLTLKRMRKNMPNLKETRQEEGQEVDITVCNLVSYNIASYIYTDNYKQDIYIDFIVVCWT